MATAGILGLVFGWLVNARLGIGYLSLDLAQASHKVQHN
jgi:hypothetical protein